MEYIKEYKNQITVLIAVFVLVLGYNSVSNSKIAESQRKEKAVASAAKLQQLKYDLCVDSAEESYWEYMKLNGTEHKDGTVTALDRFWKAGADKKEAATDLCYRQYKQ